MGKMFLPGSVALPLAGFAIFNLSEGHFGCQNGTEIHQNSLKFIKIH